VELQHALRDIDFDVARGEFLGVVGRNGSGKSTLLKIVAGIYAPTRGTVTVRGKLVPFIELGVGFNPELTGRENVYLNGALLGFSRSEVAGMYDDIVAFAELEDSMDQKLKNYSSGMQVRIAFSMATRARGDIILIDEVLAVGDAAFQRRCYEHFRTLKRRGTTIVFVSHAMDAVRQFCDRAILIEDCRLVAEGSADRIAKRYTELFNPPEPKTASTADKQTAEESLSGHTGSGVVRYVQANVPEVLRDETDLTLDLRVNAAADVQDVLYSFVIRNSSGAPVMGTDSALKTIARRGLKQGQVVDVRWTVPNIFSDGIHHVEVAATDPQGVAVYDRWEDAASFTVFKHEKTPYIVSPPATLSVDDVRD
jgi:ABC-2 type transport system ATP-binding protein